MSTTLFVVMSDTASTMVASAAAKATVAMSMMPFADPTTPPPSGKQGTVDPTQLTGGEPFPFVVKILAAIGATVFACFALWALVSLLVNVLKLARGAKGLGMPIIASALGLALSLAPAVMLSFVVTGSNWIQTIMK